MPKSKLPELTRIFSANDAQERSEELEGIWSDESQLSQRLLVYIASLLEEQNRYLLAIARERRFILKSKHSHRAKSKK